MKILSLFRHAKSSWQDAECADRERPLAGRGKKDAKAMGAWLGQVAFSPDRILVSPARRAADTAARLGRGLGIEAERFQDETRLYEAELATLLEIVGALPDTLEHVALVGHNPGLTELACHLGERAIDNLPTGSLCTLVFAAGTWPQSLEAKARTVCLLIPRPVTTLMRGEVEDVRAMPALAALRALLARQLVALLLHEPGVRSGRDNEALHDFRVAIRRIRSLLGASKGVIDEALRSRLLQAFKQLGTATSALRDLDVHRAEVAQLRTHIDASLRDALAPYDLALQQRQAQARASVLTQLDASAYTALIEEGCAFASSQDTGAGPERSLAVVADARLRRLRKRLLTLGDGIAPDSPAEELHALRKACKTFRYLLEFFLPLYPQTVLDPLIRRLRNLQDILGSFQDAEVHRQILRALERLTPDVTAETSRALEAIAALLTRRQQDARRDFAPAYGAFARRLRNRQVKVLWPKP